MTGLLLALSAMSGVRAQDANAGAEENLDCKKNVTYFSAHAQSKNYLDAYVFWKRVYDACPDESKNIYIFGPDILKWKIEQATTEEEKMGFLEELMGVYDNRIKYFGDDPKITKDYILGSKVQDYMHYMGNKSDFVKIYNWLEPTVKELKEHTDAYTLSQFTYASMARMVQEPEWKQQYVNDHLMVDGFYDLRIKAAEAAGDSHMVEVLQGYKSGGENLFAASGAADCDMMQKIYGPQVPEKLQDKDFLANVLKVLRGVGCTESDVYYAASEAMYNLEPSASAARGIALKAYKEKDYDRAMRYFEEAVKLGEDADERGECYYMMAVISYERNSYSTARNYANRAMQEKSGFGAPMLLIANMYAATAKSIFPDDPVKMRIVYCLVVDKCERARAMDPSVASEANRMIANYRNHFPSKEDVFMHPDLAEGAAFQIGGWIGESTTIRTN